MDNAFLLILVAASLLSAARAVLGPSVWDRLLGFNLFSSKVIIIIVLLAMVWEKNYLLDVALTFALLGFIGIIFIAGYIQKKGRI